VVVLNVGVGFVMGGFLAMWAWVGWMTGTTAIAVVIVLLVVVSISASTMAMAAVLSWCFGRGVAVVMDSGHVLGGISVGLGGLLLEELHEERDLV
jgi:hypothetical protein